MKIVHVICVGLQKLYVNHLQLYFIGYACSKGSNNPGKSSGS